MKNWFSWENPNLKMDDLETPISMEKKNHHINGIIGNINDDFDMGYPYFRKPMVWGYFKTANGLKYQ